MLRRLIASCATAERTRYCVVGSGLGGVFQCNFYAERVRRKATDEVVVGLSLGGVLAPLTVVSLADTGLASTIR